MKFIYTENQLLRMNLAAFKIYFVCTSYLYRWIKHKEPQCIQCKIDLKGELMHRSLSKTDVVNPTCLRNGITLPKDNDCTRSIDSIRNSTLPIFFNLHAAQSAASLMLFVYDPLR